MVLMAPFSPITIHQMKDLIFRADDSAPGKRRASVMLVYKVN